MAQNVISEEQKTTSNISLDYLILDETLLLNLPRQNLITYAFTLKREASKMYPRKFN